VHLGSTQALPIHPHDASTRVQAAAGGRQQMPVLRAARLLPEPAGVHGSDKSRAQRFEQLALLTHARDNVVKAQRVQVLRHPLIDGRWCLV
jgi:hypothetical protein